LLSPFLLCEVGVNDDFRSLTILVYCDFLHFESELVCGVGYLVAFGRDGVADEFEVLRARKPRGDETVTTILFSSDDDGVVTVKVNGSSQDAENKPYQYDWRQHLYL
jgi:hypothetical protein